MDKKVTIMCGVCNTDCCSVKSFQCHWYKFHSDYLSSEEDPGEQQQSSLDEEDAEAVNDNFPDEELENEPETMEGTASNDAWMSAWIMWTTRSGYLQSFPPDN
ncbi:unnamed protein product [Didymodactylos carnosus]|uniref:Uncharacterized protein n=2 Tax=Didymodactylos carnosus TaxID=1234261 RepID=A0A815IZG9_9BILA|nr:unnamed protein product [Didymodactylos carnosus]CAF4264846.1 unnamed protein product [Didymodactylos carnosus]